MKHIKFQFAEPVMTIQRVRLAVFLGEDGDLWVLSKSVHSHLIYLLKCFGIPVRGRLRTVGGYNKIHLEDGYSFTVSSDGDEIIVMKGCDKIRVEDALGNDVTPPLDLDIDEGYEEMCNRSGCELCL